MEDRDFKDKDRNRRDGLSGRIERRRSRDRSPLRGRSDDYRRRHRSISRSRSRSRGRRKARYSRSRSNSSDDWLKIKAKRQAKREEENKLKENDIEKEKKLWDKPPEGVEINLNHIPGTLVITPQLLQATMVAANPQQSRQARRIYVGNIRAGVTELEISDFFNLHLKNTGKCHHYPPVGTVQIHAEKAFAFLEMVRVEDATLCMLLDGIVFDNQKVKIRRPKDYVPIPGLPSNPEELGEVVLPGIVSTNVKDTPYKVYLGNLPTHLTDAQVQTLVSAFGPLKSFHLVTVYLFFLYFIFHHSYFEII